MLVVDLSLSLSLGLYIYIRISLNFLQRPRIGGFPRRSRAPILRPRRVAQLVERGPSRRREHVAGVEARAGRIPALLFPAQGGGSGDLTPPGARAGGPGAMRN